MLKIYKVRKVYWFSFICMHTMGTISQKERIMRKDVTKIEKSLILRVGATICGCRATRQVEDRSRMQPNARGTRKKKKKHWKGVNKWDSERIFVNTCHFHNSSINKSIRFSIICYKKSISHGTYPFELEMRKHPKGKEAKLVLSKGGMRFILRAK